MRCNDIDTAAVKYNMLSTFTTLSVLQCFRPEQIYTFTIACALSVCMSFQVEKSALSVFICSLVLYHLQISLIYHCFQRFPFDASSSDL